MAAVVLQLDGHTLAIRNFWERISMPSWLDKLSDVYIGKERSVAGRGNTEDE